LLEPYEESDALRIGSSAHYWLRSFHLFGVSEPAIDRFYSEVTAFDADTEYEISLAKAMAKGYEARYGKDEFNVLAAEKTVRTKIALTYQSCIFAGKIDMIIQADNGVWVVEHKTASSMDDRYFERLELDPQITGYIYLASRNSANVLGVLYNVIRKPSIAQKKSEGQQDFFARLAQDYLDRPEFYFARKEIVRNDQELQEFPEYVTGVASEISFATTYPRNVSRCNLYGRCAFRSLCIEWSDELAGTYRKKTKANQELEDDF